jgi:hypothetical protein
MARTKKRSDIVEEARKRYDYAVEQWQPVYEQAREDLRFSDPTDPQQWPEEVKRERKSAPGGARPCLVFDQTQQFVRQVVNTARRNKPALKFLPVDDNSDPQLAEILQGLARQTEHESRANVAYITALDQATRGGIGYFRAVLEEVRNSPVAGQLCIKLMRVVDFSTVWPDPDFTQPDGCDMGWGFVEETMHRTRFESKWPKARVVDWDDKGWFTKDHVRVCEYYRVTEQDGQKVVEHFKLSGEEVLEESVFPGEFVPIFPVLGNEEWDEGKRRLSGCIRLARDPQITYNFERNSEFEAVAVGPKAPWLAPLESVDGLEKFWNQANRGNLAYLPFRTLDEQGNPIPFKPERVPPAGIATGWTQLAERSRQDVQSALGMYQASVGNNPNDQSGRAVLALQDKADVGSFHYVDNLALAIAHCGRVLTQVWPVIYDQEQIIRILGEDDTPEFVRVDPEMPMAYAEAVDVNGKKTISINPGVGRYDVIATVGPAFMTRQAEAAAEIGEMVNGNPQLMALLGDVWVKMRNFPEADKVAKRLRSLLPPQVQQAEAEEGEQQGIPPQIMAVLQQAQQEIQALQQQLQESQSGMAAKQLDAQVKMAEIASKERMEASRRQLEMAFESMRDDQKRDAEELRAALALMLQRMEAMSAPPVEGEKPEKPQAESPAAQTADMALILAEALGRLGAPRSKRVQLVAPSGQVYQGQIDEGGE